MHKRTAHRWRLTAIMMAAAFLALGTFWLAQLMENRDAGLQADASKNEPDYIVEKFSFVRMSPGGQPRYVISGERLEHLPLDDSADIDQPLVRSVGADQPPTVIQARHARINHGNTEVLLTGDVQVERKAGPQARPVRLRTEALTIYPDKDQMKTDRPVEMVSDGSTVTGTGLFVDNAARQLNIASKVHITYPAAQRR